jgi:hypothetical protein
MHHTRGGDGKRGFPGLASKPVAMVYQCFDLKTTVMIFWFRSQNQGRRFGDLGLKIIITVSWFGSHNQSRRFDDLSLKIIATVSWFVPQNQGEKVCRFAPQNR